MVDMLEASIVLCKCARLATLHIFCFRRGTPGQIVDACLRRSPLWGIFHVYQLEVNIRVLQASAGDAQAQAAEFAQWLL